MYEGVAIEYACVREEMCRYSFVSEEIVRKGTESVFMREQYCIATSKENNKKGKKGKTLKQKKRIEIRKKSSIFYNRKKKGIAKQNARFFTMLYVSIKLLHIFSVSTVLKLYNQKHQPCLLHANFLTFYLCITWYSLASPLSISPTLLKFIIFFLRL